MVLEARGREAARLFEACRARLGLPPLWSLAAASAGGGGPRLRVERTPWGRIVHLRGVHLYLSGSGVLTRIRVEADPALARSLASARRAEALPRT